MYRCNMQAREELSLDVHFDQRIQIAVLPATVTSTLQASLEERGDCCCLAKSISSRASEKDRFAIFELLFRSVLKSKIAIILTFSP